MKYTNNIFLGFIQFLNLGVQIMLNIQAKPHHSIGLKFLLQIKVVILIINILKL